MLAWALVSGGGEASAVVAVSAAQALRLNPSPHTATINANADNWERQLQDWSSQPVFCADETLQFPPGAILPCIYSFA